MYCCSSCSYRGKIVQLRGRKKEANIAAGIKSTKGKYNRNPSSLLDLSPRTVGKILNRLKLGCSRCGRNEATCDIHHMFGRKIENANNHKNLTYICPNCHRLFHNGKIGPNDIKSLDEQIGDRWKEFYYG